MMLVGVCLTIGMVLVGRWLKISLSRYVSMATIVRFDFWADHIKVLLYHIEF